MCDHVYDDISNAAGEHLPARVNDVPLQLFIEVVLFQQLFKSKVHPDIASNIFGIAGTLILSSFGFCRRSFSLIPNISCNWKMLHIAGAI